MSTQFSQIVGAIVSALQATPAVCQKVYRARPDSIPEQFDQAVNVQWEQGIAGFGTIHGAPIDWTTKVSVECFARSQTDTGDVAVDPLLSAVFARLAQDTTLGGLVADLNVAGIEAENSTDAKKTGWVRLTYIVQHRTDNGTLN
jgi:hypothetical protein